jgi:hypothetical protein
MRITGKSFIWFFLFLISASLWGADYEDGRIRLSLNEETGRFSLYYMTDISRSGYEALFTAQDPRTSLLTLNLNDKFTRLGDTNTFKIRIGGSLNKPSLIFESSMAILTEEFTFIKTADSQTANGVQITLTIENKRTRSINAGLRFLLDTSLGENKPAAPFITDRHSIFTETLFDGTRGDQWWLTSNDHLSFMGSISAGESQKPDLVHFANWKRLNDVPWKTAYDPERNFNYLPHSIGDSAVAYYFEPRKLEGGESMSYYLLLAAGNSKADSVKGFINYTASTHEDPGPMQNSGVTSSALVQSDLGSLQNMIARIDAYVNSGFPIHDEDLLALELEILQLQNRYGTP